MSAAAANAMCGFTAKHSPDGQLLAAASGKTVRLWHAADGSLVHELNVHDNTVNGVAFAPDGDRLIR